MEINIKAELVQDEGIQTILKGRLQRHREDVAGDTEASFLAEWQIDRGDGDAVLFSTTVDEVDVTAMNATGVIAEALNEIPIEQYVRNGDYPPRTEPTWREALGLTKRANRLE